MFLIKILSAALSKLKRENGTGSARSCCKEGRSLLLPWDLSPPMKCALPEVAWCSIFMMMPLFMKMVLEGLVSKVCSNWLTIQSRALKSAQNRSQLSFQRKRETWIGMIWREKDNSVRTKSNWRNLSFEIWGAENMPKLQHHIWNSHGLTCRFKFQFI